jgi:hypothetical protein
MDSSSRRTAIATGVLFVVATATDLLATAVLQPLLTGSGYLGALAEDPARVSVGALLEFVAAGTCAGIAIALYPVLKRFAAGFAMGSVVFRAIEGVMYTVATLSLLSLLAIAQSAAAAAGPDRPGFQTIGDSFVALREVAVNAGVGAFVVGALLYYVVMFRSRLVPRWLSAWGIGAELLLAVACLAALFNHVSVTSYALLALPIAVQEMVLAAWLITKGFSTSALAGAAADRESTGRGVPVSVGMPAETGLAAR